MSAAAPLSVIIPTLDAAASLPATLAMLAQARELVVRLGGNFQNDEYANVGTFRGRNDKSYRANFSLIYNIQLWLSTSIGYEFERYVSNESTIIDYDVNRVSLRVSVGY